MQTQSRGYRVPRPEARKHPRRREVLSTGLLGGEAVGLRPLEAHQRRLQHRADAGRWEGAHGGVTSCVVLCVLSVPICLDIMFVEVRPLALHAAGPPN